MEERRKCDAPSSLLASDRDERPRRDWRGKKAVAQGLVSYACMTTNKGAASLRSLAARMAQGHSDGHIVAVAGVSSPLLVVC